MYQESTTLQKLVIELLELGEKNRDFIMNGDNSSIINLLYGECIENIPQGLGGWIFYAEKLLTEIGYFLNGEEGKSSQNQGQKIAGTNIRLSLKDNNPYGKMEAHPLHKKSGGIQGWGEKEEEDWLGVYEKTFALLKKVDEGFYEELNNIITKIVPLGTARDMHNSSSYKECIGHLYMGYTINSDVPELNNLEAIIHESSHNKINLIRQFDPLVLNNYEEKYYSPYRPDARHIHGVFLGIQAFVPVIYVLMKAFSKGNIEGTGYWEEKIALYYLKNKICAKVLKKYGNFSELGNEIMDEIYEVMKMTDKIFKSLKFSSEIISNIKQTQGSHFNQVNTNYPHLEY